MLANVESSRGLIFSQQVLLSLVDKGLSREDSYKIVQRNAMKSWDEGHDFRSLLKNDPDALASLSVDDMEKIFDYGYYTKHIDETFNRIGLSK